MKSNQIVEIGKKIYGLFITVGGYLQHLVLLLFRINWGIGFIETGLGKIKNHDHTVQFFTSLGIPLPGLNAWIAASVEFFGGILLLLGLATRPVGTLLAFTMCVAYLSVEKDRQTVFHLFENPDAFVAATPFLFLATAVLMICFGPGVLSVDFLLGKYVFNKEES